MLLSCIMMSALSAPAILHHSDSGIRTIRRSLQGLATCMSRSTWPACIIHLFKLISMVRVINKKQGRRKHFQLVRPDIWKIMARKERREIFTILIIFMTMMSSIKYCCGAYTCLQHALRLHSTVHRYPHARNHPTWLRPSFSTVGWLYGGPATTGTAGPAALPLKRLYLRSIWNVSLDMKHTEAKFSLNSINSLCL